MLFGLASLNRSQDTFIDVDSRGVYEGTHAQGSSPSDLSLSQKTTSDFWIKLARSKLWISTSYQALPLWAFFRLHPFGHSVGIYLGTVLSLGGEDGTKQRHHEGHLCKTARASSIQPRIICIQLLHHFFHR